MSRQRKTPLHSDAFMAPAAQAPVPSIANPKVKLAAPVLNAPTTKIVKRKGIKAAVPIPAEKPLKTKVVRKRKSKATPEQLENLARGRAIRQAKLAKK